MAKSSSVRPPLRETIRSAFNILRGLYHAMRDEGFTISVYRDKPDEPFIGYFFPEGEAGMVVDIEKKPRQGGVDTIITIHRKGPEGPNPELN